MRLEPADGLAFRPAVRQQPNVHECVAVRLVRLVAAPLIVADEGKTVLAHSVQHANAPDAVFFRRVLHKCSATFGRSGVAVGEALPQGLQTLPECGIAHGVQRAWIERLQRLGFDERHHPFGIRAVDDAVGRLVVQSAAGHIPAAASSFLLVGEHGEVVGAMAYDDTLNEVLDVLAEVLPRVFDGLCDSSAQVVHCTGTVRCHLLQERARRQSYYDRIDQVVPMVVAFLLIGTGEQGVEAPCCSQHRRQLPRRNPNAIWMHGRLKISASCAGEVARLVEVASQETPTFFKALHSILLEPPLLVVGEVRGPRQYLLVAFGITAPRLKGSPPSLFPIG